MSTYTQFGYPYTSAASQLPTATSAAPSTVMSSVTGTGTGGSTACCETGRPVATDPVTGQVICSCQYESARLSLNSYAPRLGSGTALSYGTASYPSTEHNPYPSIGVDSAAYFSQFTNPYALKEGGGADMSVYGSIGGTASYGYNPYDPSIYGYGTPYDLASRRKNATRESTTTLKTWLNEHKKNPYPTKGEKIMLAIITKMTLTQVSTWFANARRRLKKENKMTWEPKNKTESDEEADDKDTDNDPQEKYQDCEEKRSFGLDKDINSPIKDGEFKPDNPPTGDDWKTRHLSDCISQKPKIWSLADTAVCKTPPPTVPSLWPGAERLAPHPSSSQTVTTFPLPATIPARSAASRFSHEHTISPSSFPSQQHRLDLDPAASGASGGGYQSPAVPPAAVISATVAGSSEYSTASTVEAVVGVSMMGHLRSQTASSADGDIQTDTPPQTPPAHQHLSHQHSSSSHSSKVSQPLIQPLATLGYSGYSTGSQSSQSLEHSDSAAGLYQSTIALPHHHHPLHHQQMASSLPPDLSHQLPYSADAEYKQEPPGPGRYI